MHFTSLQFTVWVAVLDVTTDAVVDTFPSSGGQINKQSSTTVGQSIKDTREHLSFPRQCLVSVTSKFSITGSYYCAYLVAVNSIWPTNDTQIKSSTTRGNRHCRRCREICTINEAIPLLPKFNHSIVLNIEGKEKNKAIEIIIWLSTMTASRKRWHRLGNGPKW